MADDPLHTGAVPANELRQVRALVWGVVAEKLNPAEVDEVRASAGSRPGDESSQIKSPTARVPRKGTLPLDRARAHAASPPPPPPPVRRPSPQVRRALGSRAIDENEQLMAEADALAEIIGDVRHRVDAKAHARRLYENPARTLVEGELRLLVRSIRRFAGGDFAEARARASRGSSRASSRPSSREDENGGGGASSSSGGALLPLDAAPLPENSARADRLLAADANDRKILDYVTGGAEALSIRAGTPRTPPRARGPAPAPRGGAGKHSDGEYSEGSRPGSSYSRPGSSYSRPGSSYSTGSGATDPRSAVEAVNQKHMNAMDVDKVAAPLRALLEEERDALMDDVEYLRECLEEEANVATRMDAPPPDVGELRAYGAKLREVWEGEKERAEHVARVERMLDDERARPGGRVGKLRALAAAVKPDDDARDGTSGVSGGGGGRMTRGGETTFDGGLVLGAGGGGGSSVRADRLVLDGSGSDASGSDGGGRGRSSAEVRADVRADVRRAPAPPPRPPPAVGARPRRVVPGGAAGARARPL